MTVSRTRLAILGLAMLILGLCLGGVLSHAFTIAAGGAASEATAAMANQSLSRNDLPGAVSLAFRALSADPDSYLPYMVLGEASSRRRENSAAIDAYSMALEKLNGSGGHFHVLKLDSATRRTEEDLIRSKIAHLKAGS